MTRLPAIGDTLNVGGTPTRMIAMKDTGQIVVMGHRDHPIHQFATWLLDPGSGSFYSGHYWETRERAEQDFNART